MLVMKFGGSSVKDAEMIKRVADIVKDKKPVVVLSAVKGVTDKLIAAMDESLEGNFDSYNSIVEKHASIISDLGLDADLVKPELDELKKALDTNSQLKSKTAQMLDYISFFGERMSVKLLAGYLNKIGVNAESHVSGDIGLLTDSNFGEATLLEESYANLNSFISAKDALLVVTGFGGKDKKGDWTTFNRGGSDYVAAIIGAAIDSSEIQIWTDVNGVMTTDPRIVPEAKTISVLSFPEAAELAYFGAKVLHPKTIQPAMEKNIPVRVLNTYEPDHHGTLIKPTTDVSDTVVKAIAMKKGITLINICSTKMLNAVGFLAGVFNIFRDHGKSVDLVATSEVNITVTVNGDGLDELVSDLEKLGKVRIEHEKAMVCLVGEGMNKSLGVAGKIFSVMADSSINIEVISQGASEINVSFLIEEKDAEKAVKALHDGFF